MSQQTAVYRFFDVDDVLLYVGITKNFEARKQQHKGTKTWWAEVDSDRTIVTWYDDEPTALRAELDAINGEHPVHNVDRTNRHYRSRREVGKAKYYMGTAEIRRELGVSRQRVQQLTNSAGFPEPFEILAAGKVWKREAVEEWARDHGRTITEDAPPAS